MRYYRNKLVKHSSKEVYYTPQVACYCRAYSKYNDITHYKLTKYHYQCCYNLYEL